MSKTRLWLLGGFVSLSVVALGLDRWGVGLLELSDKRTLAAFLGAVFAVAAAYELTVLGIGVVFRARKRAPSEVTMLAALLRAVAVVTVVFILVGYLGRLSGSWTAIAGFAGLLMGWSLQAPVSGVAAWVLVNIKRPFRVGDRVMLPAWGLIGDVTQIGMMYTVLNQVGGTVGSEEAAGRNVLIPNAMLFTNIVINFTPLQSAAYVLDEVVIRVTYNSNWDLSERILIDAATEVTGDIIQLTGQRPYIRADMYDYGVYLRLRYMTMAMDRPRIVYEITRRIFREFQKHPDVDFAIPYVFSQRTALRAGARHLEPQAVAPPAHQDIDVEAIVDLMGARVAPENAVEVQDLAKKISEMGLLQPIVVEQRPDGRFALVAGQLRLAACKLLGWKTIPGIVKAPS